MTFRATQIYVSRDVRRQLGAIARAEGGDATADSVADRLLSEMVATKYPALIALQKEIEAVEAKMLAAVKKEIDAP